MLYKNGRITKRNLLIIHEVACILEVEKDTHMPQTERN